MTWAFECWIKGVEIVRPGRFPVLWQNVKFAHVYDVQYAGVELDHGCGRGWTRRGFFGRRATQSVHLTR